MSKLNVTFYLFCLLGTIPVLPINGAATTTGAGVSVEPRIVNGTAAHSSSTRHQVSIRQRSYDDEHFGSGHTCGGTLISSNVVLTAAHCFLGDNLKYLADTDLVVVMGNLERFVNNNNTLRFDILRTIKGDFNTELEEDIALIILNGTVPANHPTVRPIALNDAPLKNNTLCQATGWGLTEEEDLSTFLRTVDLPLIDTNDCRNKTEYGSRIRKGMFCAGYLEGGRDSCVADSGGPLVCRGIQAGIVSWGVGCGKPLNPGVYTDIAYYKNWILTQLTEHDAALPKFAPVPDAATRLTLCLLLLSVLLTVNFVC